jgi:hypothetical protein
VTFDKGGTTEVALFNPGSGSEEVLVTFYNGGRAEVTLFKPGSEELVELLLRHYWIPHPPLGWQIMKPTYYVKHYRQDT